MCGEPSYIELGVPNPSLARAFYAELLGWPRGDASGIGQVDTDTLSIGVHGGDENRHFEVFFAVPDLDTSIALVTELGGSLVSNVTDSPGFGRWIECKDNQGVAFGLRQPA
jgi:hypothetical protein